MKKRIIKTAAMTGLCLAMLVGSVTAASAYFGGNEMPGPPQQQTETRMPGMPGGQMPGMPGNPNTAIAASTDTAGEIVAGTTSNSAMELAADLSNATTYNVSECGSVTITEPGTYVVTGACTDGSITVKKDVTGVVLVLKDLDLSSTEGAPLSINKNAEVQVVISGSVTLTDNENPEDEDSADAAVADAYDGAAIKVKAGASAYITGDGTLTVNGNAKNGIKAGDDSSLIIGGEDLTVSISAVNDGINGNCDVTLLSGSITISAADDAIHADHILTVGASGSGPNLTITNSTEGLEGTVVNIAGGRIVVNATDDGINAANKDAVYEGVLDYSVNITGGDVTVSTNADGIDSNGNVNLIGGSASIRSASMGGEAGIDYDGELYISDEFLLNNVSGVAGPDNMGGGPGQMGGQMGGAPGGMNGMPGGAQTPPEKPNGENSMPGDGQVPSERPDGDSGIPGGAQTLPEELETPDMLTVQISSQNVTVDDVAVAPQIYNVNGYNYFKLRDLAMLLKDSGVRFSVSYDESSRTIRIVTGEAYIPVGGELVSGADLSNTCVKSSQNLIINGEPLSLEAFNIGGNNYFKLRDLGDALGFGVDYDEASRTAKIAT